jgi:hypothetical protein
LLGAKIEKEALLRTEKMKIARMWKRIPHPRDKYRSQQPALFVKQFLDSAQRSQQVGSLIRKVDGLVLLSACHFLKGLDVLHSQ